MDGRPSRLAVETSLAALVLLAVFLCGYSAVGSTNFGGYDEWWIRALGDRLILGVPYANRPLNFLWTLPGSIVSSGFTGYYLVHGLYLWLAGVLLYALLRRLRAGDSTFALLAAAFVMTWAPSDRARLCTVQGTFTSGATMSLLLAVALLVEARWRGSRAMPAPSGGGLTPGLPVRAARPAAGHVGPARAGPRAGGPGGGVPPRRGRPDPSLHAPRAAGRRAAPPAGGHGAGLAAAWLGYAPYVLSRIGNATDRTQYVSGPGIATALAAAAVPAARPLPERWRWLAAVALGCWVVAVGTGRTLAMQT